MFSDEKKPMEDSGVCKLTLYAPITEEQLNLGPDFLERYLRTVLTEALDNALKECMLNIGNERKNDETKTL